MMAEDHPADTTPIALSPAAYARHEEAVTYVENLIRTRVPRRGLGRFPGASSGAWGILAANDTIAAASGTSLGMGSVKLCDKDGNIFKAYGDTEGNSVPVLNSGAEISGGSTGKIIRLGWTNGDWAVTCRGGV